MYGMVNRAVEGLIARDYGASTWEEIRRRAGVDVGLFHRMHAYDDAITYRLVGAASEVLGAPADTLLEAFGRYWVLYVAEEGYGGMLSLAGESLPEFLGNLDALHAHVAVGHPAMRPPQFELEHQGDGWVLHYRSTREGLGAMVVGLVQGLAERFDETVEVTWLRASEGESDHDRFHIVRT